MQNKGSEFLVFGSRISSKIQEFNFIFRKSAQSKFNVYFQIFKNIIFETQLNVSSERIFYLKHHKIKSSERLLTFIDVRCHDPKMSVHKNECIRSL